MSDPCRLPRCAKVSLPSLGLWQVGHGTNHWVLRFKKQNACTCVSWTCTCFVLQSSGGVCRDPKNTVRLVLRPPKAVIERWRHQADLSGKRKADRDRWIKDAPVTVFQYCDPLSNNDVGKRRKGRKVKRKKKRKRGMIRDLRIPTLKCFLDGGVLTRMRKVSDQPMVRSTGLPARS